MGVIFNRVVKNATQFPDKLAIVEHCGETLSYAQLLSSIEKILNFFDKVIKPRNSRVAICMQEGINIPITVIALNGLFCPIIPINPGFKPKQINNLLNSVDADVILIDQSTAHLAKELNDGVLVIDISLSIDTYINKTIEDYITSDYMNYDQFLITLSSGSTGNPKPVIYSEQNKIDRSKQAVQLFNVSQEDIILCASPFFHSLGQRLTLLPLLLGATLIQVNRFSGQNWCEAVFNNKVTFTIPVSSHLHELVDIFLNSSDRLKSLRCIVSSSAAIDFEVKKQLINFLDCDFHEMYGASEVATASNLDKKKLMLKLNSVGKPCPGVEIKIFDKNKNNSDVNQLGQIGVKSPLKFSGYYQLPELTKLAFHEGYFLTGDLGYLDEDNYLYFVDRMNDIIITGGMNIYPSDIESVILENPKVSSCIVLGINDSYLVEVPVAVLISSEDERLIESELRLILKQRLAAYQLPMKFFFKEKLPLNASGKIDKVSIRAELNALNLDLSSKLRSLMNYV